VCYKPKSIVQLDDALYKAGVYFLLSPISLSIYHNPKIFQIEVTDLKRCLTKHHAVKIYEGEEVIFANRWSYYLQAPPVLTRRNPSIQLYIRNDCMGFDISMTMTMKIAVF
jgi:hypothetical protein